LLLILAIATGIATIAGIGAARNWESDDQTETVWMERLSGIAEPQAIWWVAASVMYPSEQESNANVGDVLRIMRPGVAEPPQQGVADGEWIKEVICAYDWPCGEALAVARCESRFHADAVSPDGANYGWFQINIIHRRRVDGDMARLLDPVENARVAYAIYRDNYGWSPWSCRPY
jgi:hypothetical protein